MAASPPPLGAKPWTKKAEFERDALELGESRLRRGRFLSLSAT